MPSYQQKKCQSLFPEPESSRELPRKSNGKQNLWARKDRDPKHYQHAGWAEEAGKKDQFLSLGLGYNQEKGLHCLNLKITKQSVPKGIQHDETTIHPGIKICFQEGGRGQELTFESPLKRQTDPPPNVSIQKR